MSNSLVTDIKYLSGYVYHDRNFTKNLGYKTLEKSYDLCNGFYSEAYFKNSHIIIIYRGTDTKRGKKEALRDLHNDISMSIKLKPSQMDNAIQFYKHIEKKYKGYPIYAGGHSLGGSLAQITASCVKNLKAYTFNAFGTKQIKGFHPKYPENVINYGNSNDVVFRANIDNQVGKTYVIKETSAKRVHFEKYHPIEYMGNIDNAVEYKPVKKGFTGFAAPIENEAGRNFSLKEKLLEEREAKLAFYTSRLAEDPKKVQEREEKHVTLEELKSPQEAKKQKVRDIVEGKVEFDEKRDIASYENKKLGSNKIFTQEEIDSMPEEEKHKNKSAIFYQKQTIGIPTEEQAKKTVTKGGMVFVNGYTRSDGTEVKSYYRSR